VLVEVVERVEVDIEVDVKVDVSVVTREIVSVGILNAMVKCEL
jgi:hypothetical protein